MKNFDLVNYLKNNSLINEVKAVVNGYLEIKLTPESEYGDDRDREKIIIPKYSYRLDKDSIDFLQSKETIIPEEEGFFPYLHAVLEEYVEKSKREDLTKLSVRNQLVQDLINDLNTSFGDKISAKIANNCDYQTLINYKLPNYSDDINIVSSLCKNIINNYNY